MGSVTPRSWDVTVSEKSPQQANLQFPLPGLHGWARAKILPLPQHGHPSTST